MAAERRAVRTDRRGDPQISSVWLVLAAEVLRNPDSGDAARELARRVIDTGTSRPNELVR